MDEEDTNSNVISIFSKKPIDQELQVIDEQGVTTGHISPAQVLDAVKSQNFTDVLVLAQNESGEHFFSSTSDAALIMFLIERCKFRLSNLMENPDLYD